MKKVGKEKSESPSKDVGEIKIYKDEKIFRFNIDSDFWN